MSDKHPVRVYQFVRSWIAMTAKTSMLFLGFIGVLVALVLPMFAAYWVQAGLSPLQTLTTTQSVDIHPVWWIAQAFWILVLLSGFMAAISTWGHHRNAE